METLVGHGCRAPGAASEHGGGVCPSPFDVFPGGQGCGPSGAGADALRGPSVPEGPSPALGRPQRGDLAPGSAGLTPGQKGALSWKKKKRFKTGEQKGKKEEKGGKRWCKVAPGPPDLVA